MNNIWQQNIIYGTVEVIYIQSQAFLYTLTLSSCKFLKIYKYEIKSFNKILCIFISTSVNDKSEISCYHLKSEK